MDIGLCLAGQTLTQHGVGEKLRQTVTQGFRVRLDQIRRSIVQHLSVRSQTGGEYRGARVEIRINLHRSVEAFEPRGNQDIGPPEQIVQVAKRMKIDLIAIGIPAGRSIADSIRGTIAERVLQRSECPVLAVNAYAARVLPARVVTESELVTAG